MLTRRSTWRIVVWALLGGSGVACGGVTTEPASTMGSGGHASTVTTATGATGGTGGGGPDIGQPSNTFPAPHGKPPVVVHYSGPVLTAPRFVPVFFANDDASVKAALTGFLAKVGPSKYWAATTSEYGVGPGTSTPPVELAEEAPAQIDDADIQTWLAGKLNGDDPAWPAADGQTIYVLNYPPATTITATWGSVTDTSCQQMGGYHSDVLLDMAHGEVPAVYAVIPTCSDVDTATSAASHELIEASTDPLGQMVPAYAAVDNDHFYWETVLGAGEVGDMCAQNFDSFTPDTDVPYTVQRSWSNAAALASHDPCVPAPAGEVYFNAVPVLPDKVALPTAGGTLLVHAVKVAAGETRTIEVDLFSDGDTGGPFYVDVQDMGYFVGAQPMTLSLDANEGQNGQKLHLTIGVDTAGPTGYSIFMLTSSLGAVDTQWLGLVAN